MIRSCQGLLFPILNCQHSLSLSSEERCSSSVTLCWTVLIGPCLSCAGYLRGECSSTDQILGEKCRAAESLPSTSGPCFFWSMETIGFLDCKHTVLSRVQSFILHPSPSLQVSFWLIHPPVCTDIGDCSNSSAGHGAWSSWISWVSHGPAEAAACSSHPGPNKNPV